MSDNRRIYRTIRTAIRQLYPDEPKRNFARNLNTLAAMITGIVQGKNCQLPAVARHAPDAAKPESRIKRYSRWIQNERVMIAACLAYLWMVYLGVTARQEGWVEMIHRADRCDWSLFRLGLCLLEHLLNEDLPIPVAFNCLEMKSVRY